MKLKTKFEDDDFDLDEVVEAIIYNGGHGRIKLIAEAARGGEHTFYFESLKDLNDLFEDYEEPKEYWYIYGTSVRQAKCCNDLMMNERKQIGNYFETKEEAEKAVEKLKAWKRLKDKGFRFELWEYDGGNYQERINTGRILFRVKDYKEVDELLDLLFGGGE